MLLKKIFKILDFFLPSQLSPIAEAPLVYRGRIIVATNIVGTATCFILILVLNLLKLAPYLSLGVSVCIITLLGQLYFIKSRKTHFELSLKIGAMIQVFVIVIMVYLTAFSNQGMGFFGLIWLMPIFLMIAFYFNQRFSFYFSIFHFVMFLIISYLKFDHFYDPIKIVPHFSSVFFIFLSLALAFNFVIAYLFVHHDEELQKEILKQRDLLVESAKFQSLGQMASNLAHDINNPLFTIQGKLHQMRNLLSRDQLDLEKCDQIVESVEVTLLRLSQIVKGVSTFAREGRGDQMVSISVAELIESNLALAIDRIKNSGIELEIQIDPEAKLICYPSFISQVLLNLLNNAIDALESVSYKKIEVKAFSEKEWIYIKVSDSGQGVSKGNESRIFDPFFTTKTFGKGTGLGLSISKGLIDIHEGELIYERSDQKTNFLVKLPNYE